MTGLQVDGCVSALSNIQVFPLGYAKKEMWGLNGFKLMGSIP